MAGRCDEVRTAARDTANDTPEGPAATGGKPQRPRQRDGGTLRVSPCVPPPRRAAARSRVGGTCGCITSCLPMLSSEILRDAFPPSCMHFIPQRLPPFLRTTGPPTPLPNSACSDPISWNSFTSTATRDKCSADSVSHKLKQTWETCRESVLRWGGVCTCKSACRGPQPQGERILTLTSREPSEVRSKCPNCLFFDSVCWLRAAAALLCLKGLLHPLRQACGVISASVRSRSRLRCPVKSD